MTESLAPRERQTWVARRRGRKGEDGEGLTAELDTDGEKEKESPMEIRRFLREGRRGRGRRWRRRSIVMQHEDSLSGVCFVPRVPIYRVVSQITKT